MTRYFKPLLPGYDGQIIILADTGSHRGRRDPPNVKICRRGQCNGPIIMETVFSMMSVAWHTKTTRHRTWGGFEASLAHTLATFNTLTQWNALKPDASGNTRLSISQFTL